MTTMLEPRVQSALQGSGLIDITTKGRASGEPRRLEIVFHNLDGRIYISGMAREAKRQWLRNLEADPHLTFHLKRGVKADLPATARIITDEGERRRVLGPIAQTWRASRQLDKMVRYSPLIEVLFD